MTARFSTLRDPWTWYTIHHAFSGLSPGDGKELRISRGSCRALSKYCSLCHIFYLLALRPHFESTAATVFGRARDAARMRRHPYVDSYHFIGAFLECFPGRICGLDAGDYWDVLDRTVSNCHRKRLAALWVGPQLRAAVAMAIVDGAETASGSVDFIAINCLSSNRVCGQIVSGMGYHLGRVVDELLARRGDVRPIHGSRIKARLVV